MAAKLQLNIRLTQEQSDALDAAVFVRELRSPQDLVQPLIDQVTTGLKADPEIKAAMAARSRTRADEKDNVRHLPRSADAP